MPSLSVAWPMVPLGMVCDVGAGNGAPQGEVYFSNGKYPFIRMQDVGRCETPYITTTVDRLNDLALEKHSLRLWPENSLLIPKSGASVALNKRALLRQPAYVVSHLAVLVPGPLIDHEYLYFLSSTLDMMRLALDPAYPSLRTSDLARLRIPLPPMSEQRRIVEILQEAEDIRRLRSEAEAKTAELIPSSFFKFFGDADEKYIYRPLRELVEDFRYGTSKSSGERGEITLRIPNILGSRISYDDLVKVDESENAIEKLILQTGDMLFVRTNGNPDYVGRCGVFDKDEAKQMLGNDEPVIYASYLIRARLKLNLLRPWFLHAFLRSPVGRAKILKQARTAAGQYNINTEGLGLIRVPVPPLEVQDQFLQEASRTQQITEIMRLSEKQLAHLVASLSAHAFSGQLTAEWREEYADRLAIEARERDSALKKAGATITHSRSAMTLDAAEDVESVEIESLKSTLNREQRDLYTQMIELRKRENNETDAQDSPVWYFTADSLSKTITGPLRRNPQAIEGHLTLFSALGLVIPLSLEEQTEDTGEFIFANAFRLPITDNSSNLTYNGIPLTIGESAIGEGVIGMDHAPGDYARGRELERLVAQLEKERYLK